MTEKLNDGFGSYMLINSVVQTIMGFTRRGDQDKAADVNTQFQNEMRKNKDNFHDEIESMKVANMRTKMQFSRKYRAIEKKEATTLKDLTDELSTFCARYSPVNKAVMPLIVETVDTYSIQNYDSRVPLNVIMLHTLQKSIDYTVIYDKLENMQPSIRNVIYRRWCDKDVARNSAIFNLHAIMSNIPTLVISPYFRSGKIHFTVAMWEAQNDLKPLIRPAFSIDCNINELKSNDGRIAFQDRMAFIATVVTGCARDSYMLLTQGVTPTLPRLLIENHVLQEKFLDESNTEVRNFVVNEYESTALALKESNVSSDVFSVDEINILSSHITSAIDVITNTDNLKV